MKLWQRIKKIPRWLMILVVVLVALRLALPYVGLKLINWALAHKLQNYTGHIEDFDLCLYRGAFQVQGLTIRKKGVDLPPILSIDLIDLSLAWRALLRKEITADIKVERADLELIDSERPAVRQFGTDEKTAAWRNALHSIVPVKIESLAISDSAAGFRNYEMGLPLSVRLREITFKARDLRSRENKKGEVNSPFSFSATLQDSARIWAKGVVNVLARPPAMDADFELTGFDLHTVNKFLIKYVPIDVTHGDLSIYGEAATAHGKGIGYVKLFFHKMDVVAPEQRYNSTKHYLREFAGSFVNSILQNSKTKEFATRVPFSWSGSDMSVNASRALASAIKNKEKENGLTKGMDHIISLDSLQ